MSASTAKKASAAAVSRVLSEAGLRKSTSHTTRIKGWHDVTTGFRAPADMEG